VFFYGCWRKHAAPNVDHINVEVRVTDFYDDLFSFPADSFEERLPFLKAKYGDYFRAYSMGIVGAGDPDGESYPGMMNRFLTYEPNREVVDSVRAVFGDDEWLKTQLEQAFKYQKYYFPDEIIPHVYLHISGFNQSVVIDSSWVSVSAEKYLGSDCAFYKWLSIPVYLRRGMQPCKVVPDIMKAIAISNFAYNDSVDNLLNQMVYNGKILYYVQRMMPGLPDSLLFDYTQQQLDWADENESQMWATLVEKKHLFSNDKMTMQRYLGEAPFSYYFGQESPGQIGNYFGLKIVNSFMAKHDEVTLPQLMQMSDGQALFTQAGYQP
jgi:hypothetical protein